MLDGLGRDVRQALRALRHARGFTLAVVASLAIGMAVTIAAFAFLNALLFRPFPGVAQQELVRLSVSQGCGRPDCWRRMASAEDYVAMRATFAGLQGLAGYSQHEFSLALPEVRTAPGFLTSPDYFEVLGTRPIIGRAFDSRDEAGRSAVAVISYSLWAGDFAGDPAVTERSLRVGGIDVQIVGVAPPFFAGIDMRPGDPAPAVWLPLWVGDRVLPGSRGAPTDDNLSFVGRLQHGVALAQVRAESDVVAARLAATRGAPASPARADVSRVWRTRPEYWYFTSAIVLPIPVVVLALACVNAANLLLARGSRRLREIAVRLAIGASRGRVIRQLLIESAVLALLAAAAGVPIAWWALRLASNPLRVPIPIDGTVLGLTLLTTAVTTLAFGLAPAMRATARQPSAALGPVSAGSDAVPRQSRMRRVLIVAQVSLSLALLATASQLVDTLQSQSFSGGTPPDRILVTQFDLRPLKRPGADVDDFYRRLLDDVRHLPGVEAAGLSRHSSVWTFGRAANGGSIRVWEPGDRADGGNDTIGGMIAGDLFQAIGLRLAAGRVFNESETQEPPRVAIVNQTLAARMKAPALGSVLRVAASNGDFSAAREVQIVGIVEPAVDAAYAEDHQTAPRVYLPSALEPEPTLALYTRARANAVSLAQPLRDLVGRIAPPVPIGRVESFQELIERSLGPQLWLARAAAVLGLVGLLLATAGVYGVSSYIVAMRSRELAIRIAIGAGPRAILGLMLREWMRLAGCGVVLGGGIALVASRVIESHYHGVRGIHPQMFAATVALFTAAMLAASALPAIRASRIDPVDNLKNV